MSMATNTDLITVKTAADMIGLVRSTMNRLTEIGRIEPVWIDGHKFVRRVDVEAEIVRRAA